MSISAGPNTRITLHFSLSLEDGSEVDSTFSGQPASFNWGDGSLLSSVEAKLQGMTAGQREQFDILPEEGFGQPNPANIQRFDREQFDEEVELKEGLVLSFADARNAELPGVIKSFDEQTVTVDFNHPLAGHTLRFDAQILEIQPQAVVN